MLYDLWVRDVIEKPSSLHWMVPLLRPTHSEWTGVEQRPDSDYLIIVQLSLNISSSSHNCVCVVDGSDAMAAI